MACGAPPTLACLMCCILMLQRLVAHAEEVAYNDPPSGAAEQLILNQHLYRLLRHNKLSAFQRFVQQVCAVPLLGVCFCSRAVLAMALCLIDSAELASKFNPCCMAENVVGQKQALAKVIVCTLQENKIRWIMKPRLTCNMQVFDGYFVKYFASVVALLVYAAPIYFKEPAQRGSRDDITQDYIRSMRLLQNTSKGVGDLVLVYKRITGLAGHTSRVAELLEQVCHLTYHMGLHTHSST